VVNSHGAQHIMAATVTLSIWLERTDARVGLQEHVQSPVGWQTWGRLKEQTGEGIQGDGVGAGTLEVLGGVVAPRYRKSIVRALA
jgi:hypothetical protein